MMTEIRTGFIVAVLAAVFLLSGAGTLYASGLVIGPDSADIGMIVIVSPRAGDSAAANGIALLNALAGVTGTAENRYLIKLGPGTYNLGAESLTMQPFVSIEGSGEAATKITAAAPSSSFPPDAATVIGANNAELRFLTIENTGVGAYTTGILNISASPTLSHVTAAASGGTNSYGVYNYDASPKMTNVTATASGGTDNYAVFNNSSSSPTMTNVGATATGGTNCYGVHNVSSSSPKMTNVTATALGGTYNYGVNNVSSAAPVMTNVTATASGGTINYAVFNQDSSPTITGSTATAFTAAGTSNCYGIYNLNSATVMTNVTAAASQGTGNYGVFNDGTSSPTLSDVTATGSLGSFTYGMYNNAITGSNVVIADRSTFQGNTNSINNNPGTSVKLGASKLVGSLGGGLYTCVGVYNGTTFAALTCP